MTRVQWAELALRAGRAEDDDDVVRLVVGEVRAPPRRVSGRRDHALFTEKSVQSRRFAARCKAWLSVPTDDMFHAQASGGQVAARFLIGAASDGSRPTRPIPPPNGYRNADGGGTGSLRPSGDCGGAFGLQPADGEAVGLRGSARRPQVSDRGHWRVSTRSLDELIARSRR